MSILTKRPVFLEGNKELEQMLNHAQAHGFYQASFGEVMRHISGGQRKRSIMGFFDAANIVRGIAAGHRLYQNPGPADNNSFMEKLPPNSYIIKAWYEVLTTFTSATDAGTLALSLEVNNNVDIVTAIAISDVSDPWDVATLPVDAVQDGVTANFTEKTTGYRSVVADVAVEALTDGLLAVYVEYVQTYPTTV
jgi:hypothetical protein